MSGYVDHAWRHAPKAAGGTDPIPNWPTGGGGGGYRNPVMKYALQGADWLHFDEAGLYNRHFSSNFAFSAAVPGGAYLTNGPGGTAGDDYFIMGAPLGPQGSRWSVDVVYGKSSTGGRLLLEWQTALVDPTISAVEYPNLIGKPIVAGTWYIDNNSRTFHIDTYAAVPSIAWVTGVVDLYIAGADGAMLSADGSVPTSGPLTNVFNGSVREMNGGGDGTVMWYMRAKVASTVNASNVSGDADVSVYSVRFSRLNEGGGESG